MRALDAVIANIDADGVVSNVSSGTRMGHDLQFYRDIPIRPTGYGQALAMLCLIEGLNHVGAIVRAVCRCVLYGVSPPTSLAMDTARLRSEFLVEGLFPRANSIWSIPISTGSSLAAPCLKPEPLSFRDRSEVGTGIASGAREWGSPSRGPGLVEIDGRAFDVANREIALFGRGGRAISLASGSAKARPFYMNSVPAGADIPDRLITRAEASRSISASAARSNRRTLLMYIHPEVAPSACS